jgi:hypothetical protein
MTARVLFIAVAIAACTRPGADRDPGRDPHQPAPAAPTPVIMTHTDPHDPASWTEAEQLAAKQKVGAVKKRSAELPFLFSGERARSVLIHRGAIITKRGPVVAGAYLRDLGVPQGKGPQLDDVLWALWALDALPKVDPLGPEGYVHVPNNPRLADLTARIEYDGQSAHIVLHYFKPDPPMPKDVHVGGGTPGTAKGGGIGGTTRALVRMTLDIPERGDSAWRRDDINWADPG